MKAGQPPAERSLIEGTLGGLRFVRHQMGHLLDDADFIRPGRSRRADDGITDWKWRSVPEPKLSSLPPRRQAWEMARHRAYQAHLAGHFIGEIFRPATAFLHPTPVQAFASPHINAPAPYWH